MRLAKFALLAAYHRARSLPEHRDTQERVQLHPCRCGQPPAISLPGDKQLRDAAFEAHLADAAQFMRDNGFIVLPASSLSDIQRHIITRNLLRPLGA